MNLFTPPGAPSWLDGILRNIRSGLRTQWDSPIVLNQIATADLPSAADWTGALVWDVTTSEVKRSNGTAWAALGGGGVSDGDKGDITVSASGATWTIDAGVVTLAKMANMATASLIYRKTAGAGAPEVQTLATLKTDLGLTGTNSGDQTITLSGDATGSGTAGITVTLANSGVSAGTYKSVTVDAKGRVTAGTNPTTLSGYGITDAASLTGTETLTNKRVNPRVGTTTSSATPTINTDNYDVYGLTAQAVDITSFTTNLSGTPVDGQKLWIYVVGTAARAITWGASFEASTVALPTTTVTTNRLDVGFVWNAAASKWRCVGTA